jgi:membrane fusion protein (multidrug efflux system)
MRMLDGDGFRRPAIGLLCATTLLGAWGAWFFLARVALYEVSDTARLEANRAVHPVEASIAGRIVVNHLVVGQEAQADDVLVELDAEARRLQLQEERTRLAALAPQLDALRAEVAAQEKALGEARQAGDVSLDEASSQLREAEAAAQLADDEALRATRLHASGLLAEVDLLRARTEAQKRRATADSLRLAVVRLEREHRARESDRQARLEELQREITRLQGETTTVAAAIERLEHEIDKHLIRAPVAGRIGEVADLPVGTVVREGDKLGAIVPPGVVRIVANFLPPAALGRIQPGQPAQLRLDAFPWTQYGTVSAMVSSVASEVRDGRVRVELAVQPNPTSAIPLQHGLPGSVEVEVERISPATLILRIAGKLLAKPTK